MLSQENREFDLRGVNHLALVCKDMSATVAFYRDLLGMPLIRSIGLPNGIGQHFFFDIGNGDCLAFFWFKDAPAAQPGVSAPLGLPPRGSAHGSMNHVAIAVPAEKIDGYQKRLLAKGIKATPVISHDQSPQQASLEITPTTYVRSIYFHDPDGICLEFAAWTDGKTA